MLLVLSIQSGQPYWVCQNIVMVNKWMTKYQYQLNDMRWYWAQLEWAKWVSMLALKAGFYSIPFKSTSFYNSTFVTHKGNFWWLIM